MIWDSAFSSASYLTVFSSLCARHLPPPTPIIIYKTTRLPARMPQAGISTAISNATCPSQRLEKGHTFSPSSGVVSHNEMSRSSASPAILLTSVEESVLRIPSSGCSRSAVTTTTSVAASTSSTASSATVKASAATSATASSGFAVAARRGSAG